MIRLLMAALVVLPIASTAADASGGRLTAVSAGRIYDPLLTPQLNPGFHLEPRAERSLLRAMRDGRVDTSQIPPRQLRYFQRRLQELP